ncbi:hypothetical protein [Novosphingobium terrae]|uniref:hypothetical protein n=1 Tax=Novosphingobium terrae TaxID=2726189 RepID=UPI00197E3FAF|nr:hypothetical protein [Novosphingobium terrae]
MFATCLALSAPAAQADTAPASDAIATADAPAPWAPGDGAAASPNQKLVREFGVIGLTGEMNSDEHFGSLQARLGAYTALPATDTHPDVSLQNLVIPAHAVVSLDSAGHWFVKLGAAAIKNWADDHGSFLETTTTFTSLAQLQYRPRPGTLIGLGPTYETNIVHLAGGGRIVVPGAGLRFDLLQRISPTIGFAAKATWFDGTTTTTIPLGGDLTLHDRASTPRSYLQLGLIGMFQHQDSPLVPKGWSLRPAVHLILQRTAIQTSTTNLGTVEAGQHQDYGEVLFSTRLQKEEFRSAHPAPFVELGGEFQIHNTLPTPISAPNTAYAKAGATMRVGGWGFFDAYYAWRDSLDGTYRSGTAEVLLSVTY